MGVLDGLLDDLRSQRAYVAERCPVYARILDLLPAELSRERLETAWEGRTFRAWYERPLLILAALRFDALSEGPDHPLHSALVEDPVPDAVGREALRSALEPWHAFWSSVAGRYVQTNETSRAVAWLWPARLVAEVDPDTTLHLFDVGASAGLNLVADALPDVWTRADGTPLEIRPLPRIGMRRGFDLRPIDVSDEEGARWLRACVWPGQDDREQRLLQAVDAWRAAAPPPELVAASAADVPALLPTPGEGERALAFQTVFRDYLPEGERVAYEAGMRGWLTRSEPGAALWIELEVREEAREGGPAAALTAHLSDGDFALATCEAHPRVLLVDDGAGDAFRKHLPAARRVYPRNKSL